MTDFGFFSIYLGSLFMACICSGYLGWTLGKQRGRNDFIDDIAEDNADEPNRFRVVERP